MEFPVGRTYDRPETTMNRNAQILGILFSLLLGIGSLSISSANTPGIEGIKIGKDDWPWWRGTNRNGHANAQEVPIKWSENQNIVWRAEIPGRGHASPVVIGERIFIATADEDSQTQHIICLDKATGQTRWSAQIHQGGWKGRIHDRNTQASSTVASDGKSVFATFMHDSHIWLTSLNLKGEIQWQKKASDFVSHWGYSTSPAIYKGFVIVGSDHKEGGNLTAFDRRTGELVWNVERPAIPNYASPVIYNLNGRDQLVLPGCDLMASYDPATGQEIWSIPATTRETVGSAVTDGKHVFASGGFPKNETSCITADGSNTIVWRSPIRVYAPSMIIVDGYLYAMTDKGLAHCWNASTGDLMWREKVGGEFSASPTLVNGNLFVPSEQGKMIVFKANPEKFELLAENQLGDESWSSLAISKDRLYLRVAHIEDECRSEALYCIAESN